MTQVAFQQARGRLTAEQANTVVLKASENSPAVHALIGEVLPGGTPDAPQSLQWVPGAMSDAEKVIIARHLMRHGIVGTARPEQEGSGSFCDRFDAAEYVSAARVHLGLSSADAEALSMTEFQQMLAMKYPRAQAAKIPSAKEYDAAMAAADEFIAKLKERGRG